MVRESSNCVLVFVALLGLANAFPGQHQADRRQGPPSYELETITETRFRTVFHSQLPTDLSRSNGLGYVTKTTDLGGTLYTIIQHTSEITTASASLPASSDCVTTTIIHDVTAYGPVSMAPIISRLTADGPQSLPASLTQVPQYLTTSGQISTSTVLEKQPQPAKPVQTQAPESSDACFASGIKYTDSQNFTSSKGGIYVIHCHEDNSGGALTVYPVQTGGFRTCFDACDKTEGCLGFTYWGKESGNCYLKASKGSYAMSSNPEIMSSFKENPSQADGDPAAGSSAFSSTTLHQSPSTTVPPKSQNGQCVNRESVHIDGQGRTWDVRCDWDYAGNDIGAVSVSKFEDCFDKCSSFNRCKAFAYLAGTCYLKDKAENGRENDDVIAVALRSPEFSTAVPYTQPVFFSTQDASSATSSEASATLACNPAHAYPGGAVCTEINGSLTLAVPSTTATAPAYASQAPPSPVTVTVTQNQPPMYSLPNAVTVTVTTAAVSSQITIASPSLPTSTGITKCSVPNGASEEFVIKTHVNQGSEEFEGLYVRGMSEGHIRLTYEQRLAAPAVYVQESRIVSIKSDEGSCKWYGLDLPSQDGRDEVGMCDTTDGFGSGMLMHEENGILHLARYGYYTTWMVCRGSSFRELELKYVVWSWTDVFYDISNFVDLAECASVELQMADCPTDGLCN